MKNYKITRRSNKCRQYLTAAFLFLILNSLLVSANAQVGTWNHYLSYREIQQIQAAGDDIFVRASNGLYQYNLKDQSIKTYNKSNGLSDTDVAFIKWCPQAKRLIVVYNNSNIDLVETNGNSINVSDIYTKAIVGDKTINNITIDGLYAYLACGFGIVKMNVKNADIKESYIFGRNVESIVIGEDGYIYATMAEPYKYKKPEDFYTPFNGRENLIIPWGYDDAYTRTLRYVVTASMSENPIDFNNWIITNTYPEYKEDTSDYDTYYETISKLNPEGPKYNYFGFMKFINGKLFTCNGDFKNTGIIQVLENDHWNIYQDTGITDITGLGYFGYSCIDVDPTSNDEHVFAGGRNGLYEYRNGQFVNFYNSANSPIEGYNGKSTSNQLVTGVKFDSKGNLWILNSQAPTTSLIKFANGEFTKYNKSEIMKLSDSGFTNKSNASLGSMMIDSYGLMWFTNSSWTLPAFYQYNIDSDAIVAYENFTNQDGSTLSPGSGVKAVVEDANNDLWVCTNIGPFMLERSKINDANPTYIQVKVPRNDGTDYADYLLAGLDIRGIAVDGGGRKWFATCGDGVYLISADNMTEVHHFTKENSPLISNDVVSIAINNATGEVFFGTDKGLCSYVSDATTSNEDMDKDNVYAYPNPVTPEYTGLIAIVGLSLNADVKITNAAGYLIAEGRSNGGTFTWNGCDKNGNRVASGIYNVITAKSDGSKGTVCKIAVIK